MGKIIIYLAISFVAVVFLIVCLLIFTKRKGNHKERKIKKQKKHLKHFLDHTYSKHGVTEHEIEKFAHEAATFYLEVFDDVPLSYRQTGEKMRDIINQRGILSEIDSSFNRPEHEVAFIRRAESRIKAMLQSI